MKGIWLLAGRRFHGVTVALGVLTLLFAGPALRAQSISMSYVTVGNPNNATDPNTGSIYGSVSYTYEIGEYDVTDSQYCTFLNDVDPTGANALALYSPQGDAEYGVTLNLAAADGLKYSVIPGYANMPVVDVDYWDTLRFANWMNNGEGSASTETGAYTLLGGNTDGNGTPSNASSLLANPQHNPGAKVWLPSENEWYKAAYYEPATNSEPAEYSAYAMTEPGTPGNMVGGGLGEANYYNDTDVNGNGYSVTQSPSYSSSQNYLTPVGSFTNSASYYETYDQSGDVFNWISTTIDSEYPALRGGAWYNLADYLTSSNRDDDDPTIESSYIGFRVASVPEPNSLMLTLTGVAGLAVLRGKPLKL